jgi:glutathione S-transferase
MKLHYFDGRGTGETTRLLLKATRTEFEDMRYTFDQFKELKAAGTFASNLDRLPALEVDGVMIGQSKTCERFVAKHVGMAGTNPLEEGLIDAVCEHKRDLRDAYQPANKMEKGSEERAAAEKKYFEEDMPAFLEKVDKALPEAPGPWLVGPSMSLADVAWFQLLVEFFDKEAEQAGVQAALAKAPRMKVALDAVLANAEIRAWRESRPAGMF